MLFPVFTITVLAPFLSLMGANPLNGGATPDYLPSSGTSTGSTSDFGGGDGFDGSTLQVGDLQTTEMPTIFTYTEKFDMLTSQPTTATQASSASRLTSLLTMPPHLITATGKPYTADDYKTDMAEFNLIFVKTEEGMRLEGRDFTMFVLRRACAFADKFCNACPNICLSNGFCGEI